MAGSKFVRLVAKQMLPSDWNIITVKTRLRMVQPGSLLSTEAGATQPLGVQEAFTEDKLIAKEPYTLFKAWFEEACATPNIVQPRAMCLATSTRSGVPSARFVILRGYGSDGFRFFTNYSSRKGQELNKNPIAALTFYWDFFNRSVRIEGTVGKLPEKDSTEFFQSRPKGSQIEALFSNQSQPIPSRDVLKENKRKISEQYSECDSIPKPAEWGGYILKPHTIEFWQGQRDHIHDRIRFRIRKENEVVDNVLLHEGDNGWIYERLQP